MSHHLRRNYAWHTINGAVTVTIDKWKTCLRNSLSIGSRSPLQLTKITRVGILQLLGNSLVLMKNIISYVYCKQ